MSASNAIQVAQILNVAASSESSGVIARKFRQLFNAGHQLRADGLAKSNPAQLLHLGYTPKHEIELFGTRFFLCNQRDAHGLKVMPAYVLPARRQARGKPAIYARVFYKDSSLVWRSASHYINTHNEQWIGKGAVRWVNKTGMRGWFSAEETTNLPLEMQAALDEVSQRGPRKQNDQRVLSLVLRNAPSTRVRPYIDFAGPRLSAMKLAANRINNNKTVAWFAASNDPASLQIAAGFEPDFSAIIDVSPSRSSMYGGSINKYRIGSKNKQIQYLFVAGPKHVWIVNPQSFGVELSSYGVRTVDVVVDEDLCIPGYEFFDNAGTGEIDNQIPPGFAGDPCPIDPDRADASPWNDRMPIIKSFRRALLSVDPTIAVSALPPSKRL